MSRGLLNNSFFQEETIENTQDLSTTLLDIQEEQIEGKRLMKTLDQQTTALEHLLELSLVLENYQEGGFDFKAQRMFDSTVSSIYTTIGLEHHPVRSIESISSLSSEVERAEASMEGVLETIKLIWRKIIEGFKGLVKWVYNLFRKSTDANMDILDKAKDLKKELSHITTLDGKPTYEQGLRLSQAFRKDGKLVNPIVVSRYLLRMEDILNFLYLSSNEISTFADNVENRVRNIKKLDSEEIGNYNTANLMDYTATIGRILSLSSKYLSVDSNLKKIWNQGEGNYGGSPTLCGDKKFVMFIPTRVYDPTGDNNQAVDDFAQADTKIKLAIIDLPKKELPFQENLIPTKREEIITILDNVEKIAILVKKLESNNRTTLKNIENFALSMESALTVNDSIDKISKDRGLQGAVNRVKAIYNNLMSVNVDMVNYLTYMNRSLFTLVHIVVKDRE